MAKKEQTWSNKEFRNYIKMCKKQRKQLVKAAKKFRTFDWGYLHGMIVLMLNQMLEYYKYGVNIYQVEESKNEIINSLEKVLKYNTEYENAFKDYCRYNLPDNEYVKKETKNFEDFYKYLGKNMRKWWD